MKKLLSLLLALALLLALIGCTQAESPSTSGVVDSTGAITDNGEITEDGIYTTKEDVGLYIHLYGHLPSNFITKAEANTYGWSAGALDYYAYGMCIGGDVFYNREGLLPAKEGRTFTECDIDTLHGNTRGAKRIVFSNDGLVYYTEDHYASFELLYGQEVLDADAALAEATAGQSEQPATGGGT